eukprot:379722_1
MAQLTRVLLQLMSESVMYYSFSIIHCLCNLIISSCNWSCLSLLFSLYIYSCYLPFTTTASTFTCNTVDKCKGDVICVDNQDCFIICSVQYGCREAVIYAPENANLTVTCSNTKSCITGIIHGQTNGNVNVECNNNKAKACESLDVLCPINGNCNIDCNYGNSNQHTTNGCCYKILIDARNVISGDLFVQSIGNAIYKGNIYCPGNNNECIIQCGKYSCYDSGIWAKSTTSKLEITANGIDALRSTKIKCPSSNNICSIKAEGSGPNMLSDTEIFTPYGNGLQNVSIICNYTSTVNSACYPISSPLRLRCQSDSGVWCTLTLVSGIDTWECIGFDIDEICNDTTSDGYYGNRLVCNEANECKDNSGKWIHCANNENCWVTCSQSKSCRNSKIYAPENGNLTVTCSGNSACENAFVYGATNGSISVQCKSQAKACKSLDVFCPEYGKCFFQCIGGPTSWSSTNSICYQLKIDARNVISGNLLIESSGRGIYQGNIYCPGNNNDCILTCTNYGCWDSNIVATAPNTNKLEIIASGSYALRSTKIKCPENNNSICSIKADGSANMLSDVDLYKSNGLPDISLICNYTNAILNDCYSNSLPIKLWCQPDYGAKCNLGLISGIDTWECIGHDYNTLCNNTITPNAYYANRIVCNENQECKNQLLYCNDNADCWVTCSGSKACDGAKIYAPENGNLIVICSGNQGCQNAFVYGATNGSISVECKSQAKTCYSLDVFCPEIGNCSVTCTGPTTISNNNAYCYGIKVDARNTVSGNLLVQSTGIAFYLGNTYCPGNNNECIIQCNNKGCYDSNFWGQPSTGKLQVTGIGENALNRANIRCPENNNSICSIHGIGSGPNIITDISIYKKNGLKDISIICNYSSSKSECYSGGSPPKIRCNSDYKAWCSLRLISGFDIWECAGFDIDEICNDTTSD